jgi:lysozyme family protein
MGQSRFRSAISCLTAAALLIAQTPQVRAADPLTKADYEACQAQDEEGFRRAIEALTLKGLEAGLAKLDYGPLVADAWRRERFDETIDRQVDEAIAQVRDESTWFQLWSSLASRDSAQELATSAAERVYRSDAIKQGIERISADVAKEIGKRIELAVIDTAGPAIQCMQAFLGRRYGATVAGVVGADTGREYAIDPFTGGAQVSTGQVLVEGKEGIAGAVVLVLRRQLSRMAARIGQRVLGSVLSRLVSTVAGVVGVVLIAKDIWDFRHGVLPIIAEEMKSKATKDKVRQEIAGTLAEHVGQSVKEIAQGTAERVVDIWLDFRRAHAKVLELAERNADFKRLLDTIRPPDLPRLDEVTALVLASEGEAGIARRLGDGTLHKAVSASPPGAIEIAREARSLETALKWSAVAGESLPRVVELEVYRRATPESFTKAGLQRLLGLDDRLATVRLAALPPATRDALLELDSPALVKLARALDEPQLESLARYVTALEKGVAQRVLAAVAQSPARMADLASPRVREAIIASRDQSAAVSMMLQAASYLDPTAPITHARLVLDGRVSPVLLWEKHGLALVAAALLGLLLLLGLKRALLGPGRRMEYR